MESRADGKEGINTFPKGNHILKKFSKMETEVPPRCKQADFGSRVKINSWREKIRLNFPKLLKFPSSSSQVYPEDATASHSK